MLHEHDRCIVELLPVLNPEQRQLVAIVSLGSVAFVQEASILCQLKEVLEVVIRLVRLVSLRNPTLEAISLLFFGPSQV